MAFDSPPAQAFPHRRSPPETMRLPDRTLSACRRIPKARRLYLHQGLHPRIRPFTSAARPCAEAPRDRRRSGLITSILDRPAHAQLGKHESELIRCLWCSGQRSGMRRFTDGAAG